MIVARWPNRPMVADSRFESRLPDQKDFAAAAIQFCYAMH